MTTGSNKSTEAGEDRVKPTVDEKGLSGKDSVAPDGGYGWVIVFASFMCQIVVDGTVFSYGVFSSEFEIYFNSSSGMTSLVGSVLGGTYLMTAPVASVLTNHFGHRLITIIGSLIATLGFGISTVSPSIDALMITFGIIGGFGLGLIYLPSIVAVSEYFDKRRPLVTGIVVCGTGVGCFIFAPLFNFLVTEMGWKYSVVILAGISLNGCVFGALLRPLPRPPSETTKRGKTRSKNALDRVKEVLRIRRESIDGPIPRSVVEDRRLERVRLEKESRLEKSELEEAEMHVNGVKDSQSLVQRNSFRRSSLKQSVDGGKDRLNLSRRMSVGSASLMHLPVDNTGGRRRDSESGQPKKENKRDACLRISGLYLLKDPLFLIPCLANLFAMVGLFIPFFFITLRVRQLPEEVDGSKAALLLSIIAIFNTGGRLLIGFIAGLKPAIPLYIHNFALLTGGLSCILSMFCVNYWLTCIYAAYFGLCVAAWISLTSIILCDLLGIEKLSHSFGILNLVRGISSLVGPPIAGAVYDSTLNYDNSFHVGGVMLMAGGIVCCLLHLPSLQGRKFSKEAENNNLSPEHDKTTGHTTSQEV